ASDGGKVREIVGIPRSLLLFRVPDCDAAGWVMLNDGVIDSPTEDRAQTVQLLLDGSCFEPWRRIPLQMLDLLRQCLLPQGMRCPTREVDKRVFERNHERFRDLLVRNLPMKLPEPTNRRRELLDGLWAWLSLR